MNLTGTPLYIKEQMKPVKNLEYKKWIKTLPCLVCKSRHVDPHHVGARGLSQTASDSRCVPLCRVHHDEAGRGRRKFEARYGIDFEDVIRRLNEKPKIVPVCARVGVMWNNELWELQLRESGRSVIRARSLDRAMEIAQRIIPDFCREVYLSELPK